MSLRIYNTMTQKKEEFVSLEKDKVKMYVCGPTVYGLLHVGNFRGAVFFNVVRNWLEKSGYEVDYVYNYTDVDDKIIQRANDENCSTLEISEKYIAEFQKDYQALGLRPHTRNPKVTEHMDDIISMVENLVKRKKAYVTESGEVLYSIASFPEYGKLSGRKPEDLLAGARVEVSDDKQNPLDFVLWKPAKEGEPSWDSPWGAGRPGWHIECSAMNRAIFGNSIDIHGGGSDLVFPHHENEVAQSEGCSGEVFVRYWMHNNMITFGGQKMSKSLGNIKTARSFLEEYNAEILKYLLLSVQYRSLSDFSQKAIEGAVVGLGRVYSALSVARSYLKEGVQDVPVDKEFTQILDEASKGVEASLNDDFNTALVLGKIFEVVRAFNHVLPRGKKVNAPHKAIATAFINWVDQVGEIISLFREDPNEYLQLLDGMLLRQKNIDKTEVEALVAQRDQARQNKDFSKADEKRDRLLEMGIAILDTPQGTQWEVIKK